MIQPEKPKSPHVLEIVSCTHPVRTYLEGIDKYVAWLEWLVKEKEGVITELRDDLYGDDVTEDNRNSDPLESMKIITRFVVENKAERAKSAAIAEKANQEYMADTTVPDSDFTKMTETEQEEVTVVKTSEAGHSVTPLQVVSKRRGCPPGGWPKKDPAELLAAIPKVKPVNLDAPRKVRSNLRPYELLTSTDLLAILAHINRLGKKCLGMQEVADMALYLRIERDLMVTLIKKYGKLHRAGTAIPLILSMHAKNKGKPYDLSKLNKISQNFPSVHFPKIPATQKQISTQ